MPEEVKAVFTATSRVIAFQVMVEITQVDIKSVGENLGLATEALVLPLLLVSALIIADEGAHPHPHAHVVASEDAGAAVTAAKDGNRAGSDKQQQLRCFEGTIHAQAVRCGQGSCAAVNMVPQQILDCTRKAFVFARCLHPRVMKGYLEVQAW